MLGETMSVPYLFFDWFFAQVHRHDGIGAAARELRDFPQMRFLANCSSLAVITTNLCAYGVDRESRKAVKAAHREWRTLQKIDKFGEWPIDCSCRSKG